jgi:nickel-dependent lactate racemase
VDDLTRPTPAAEILKVLLSRLLDEGFPGENITIVMAIGTHEVMEREALETKLGKNVASTYKVVQHNAGRMISSPSESPATRRW